MVEMRQMMMVIITHTHNIHLRCLGKLLRKVSVSLKLALCEGSVISKIIQMY